MLPKVELLPVDPHSDELHALATHAQRDGYRFVDRLIEEARNGKNCFTDEGECFLGLYEDGKLIGCGGINKDPFTNQYVGRLRHIYVSSCARRKGLGTKLVRELLRCSKASFSIFRLRTSDRNADAFYEALGFEPTNDEDATHILRVR